MSSTDIFRMELNGAAVRIEDLKGYWFSNAFHYEVREIRPFVQHF